LLLVIEVDGITHESEEAAKRDQQKDRDLEAVGFTVLRFSNWEVLNRIDDVSSIILKWIEDNAIGPPPGFNNETSFSGLHRKHPPVRECF
jgi:very-short-patch-repair endonuclease